MTSTRPAAVLLATLALALTACSSSDSSAGTKQPASAVSSTGSSSPAAGSSAASSTEPAESGYEDEVTIPDKPTFGQIAKITRASTKKVGSVHASLASRGQSAESDVVYDEGGVERSDTRVTSVLDASTKVALRQRLIGKAAWQCDDIATGEWRTMTKEEKAQAASFRQSTEQQTAGINAKTPLTVVSRNAPIDGLITTHLRGSVKAGGLPVKVELWIDTQGLLRRESSVVSADGKKVTSETTYTKYGEPIDIQPPTVGASCKD